MSGAPWILIPRAYALLRAWAFHRARQGGWGDRRRGRGRVLAKEGGELAAHAIGIGATTGLLGRACAGALLEAWALAVAMRVRSLGDEIWSSAVTSAA